ncbi:MAG: helix-turn-helix transcriptional regulator [Bacteroidales bacterium]|nr:helix-turn-helix transcriptional regulator [Bacteroidales bacterium]
MKLYKLETAEDLLIGKKGNQIRDEYDSDLEQFYIGEAIKKVRISKNLTQEELGARVGVQRAQISRIEKGHNITLANMSKLFRAMKVTVRIEIPDCGTFIL